MRRLSKRKRRRRGTKEEVEELKRKKRSREENFYECFVCHYPLRVADIYLLLYYIMHYPM